MECKQAINLTQCNCSYEPCPRKGNCCACLEYHRRQDELPACYFSPALEKTYDRSLRHFFRSEPRMKR